MAPGRICIRLGLHSPAEGNCTLRHSQAVGLAGSRTTARRIIDDNMERHQDDSHRNQTNNQELLHGNTERCGSPTAAGEAGRAQKKYTNPGDATNAKRGRRLGEAAWFG